MHPHTDTQSAILQPRRSRCHRIVMRILLLLGVAAAALVAGGSPASAAPGDYEVHLRSTTGTHWMTHGRGLFSSSSMRVSSGGPGSFVAGDYRAWRITVPGQGARIIGGRISTMVLTPDASMRARILAGADSGAFVTLYDGGADGAIDRSVTGSHDWVQVDLRAVAKMQTTRSGTNVAQLTGVDLTLHDDVTPSITALSIPDATGWYGQQCTPWSTRLTDQGGGLRDATLTRLDTGLVAARWTSPQAESTRPGSTLYDFGGCLAGAARMHGRNDYLLTTSDVGGHVRTMRFALRADLVAPVIVGGPPDGARYDDGDVRLQFDISDSDSGLGGTGFTLDGHVVSAVRAGDRWLLDTGRLKVGRHVIAAGAFDAVGNSIVTERSITIGDVRAPAISLISPATTGTSTPWLSARATDDGSGVDTATWLATVNGDPVAIDVEGDRISGAIGGLAPGTHELVLTVADHTGNAARIVHHYRVEGSASPEMPAVGGQTGVFLVSSPAAAVIWGSRVNYKVYVVRAGRPQAGLQVDGMRGAIVAGSGVTGADGTAVVSFIATLPGQVVVRVAGVVAESMSRPLVVAPKLYIRTNISSPRVGQRVRISGRVLPALPGRRIRLEARVGTSWYPLRRWATTDADGTFATSVVGTTPGIIAVRARIGVGGGWAMGRSAPRMLRVRQVPVGTEIR